VVTVGKPAKTFSIEALLGPAIMCLMHWNTGHQRKTLKYVVCGFF